MSKDKKEASSRYVATIVDYKATFGTPHGKRVLRHLMRNHGMMITSYVEGKPDATAFNEGGRNVVIQILKKMQIDVKKLEAEINQEPEGESDVII